MVPLAESVVLGSPVVLPVGAGLGSRTFAIHGIFNGAVLTNYFFASEKQQRFLY